MNFTPTEGNVTGSAKPSGMEIPDIMKNVCVIFLGITVCFLNSTLVQIFNRHQTLQLNPRYILFIHLVLNDIIHLTFSILLYILVHAVRTIFVSLCVLLLLPPILVTMITPINLAVMATECYVSVCFPLRYNSLCTVKKTYAFIGLMWAISVVSLLPDLFIFLITEKLYFYNSRVLCDRENVFRSDYSTNKRDAINIFLLVVVCLTLFYTYFRILFVAKAVKADATKARNTILLHGFQVLLCMTVYVGPLLKQFLNNLFPEVKKTIPITMFVLIQILPRFLNPFVYGLRDKTFRKYLKVHCICIKIASIQR